MVYTCGMACVKYLLFIFNFIFFLSGLGLIVIGAYVKTQYGEYLTFADGTLTNAAVFLIALGVIVFIIGFLGCCGAIRESYCMVTTFAVLLGIIFVLEIVAGILGFVYKGKVKEKGDAAVARAVTKYDTEDGAKGFLDWTQKTLKCCGKAGAADYDARAKGIPGSCCGKANDKMCSKSEAHKKGCTMKFEEFVKDNLLLVGGFAIGIAFIQLLGIVFACCLMSAIKVEYTTVKA